MTKDSNASYHMRRDAQTGVALVMSLVMLLVLTIIGVSAMSGSHLELKMSANVRDTALSFEDAEGLRIAAEKAVEDVAESMRDGDPFPSQQGYYNVDSGSSPPAPGVEFRSFWETAANYTPQGYVVEYLGTEAVVRDDDRNDPGPPTTDMLIFRISVQGQGTSGARTVLQTVFMQEAS